MRYFLLSPSAGATVSRRPFFAVVALSSLLLLPGLGGCSRDAAPAAAAKAEPKRYDLRGEIVGLVPDRRVLLVHHEEIPGYMPPMTMEFVVLAADFASFKEGQRIAARMFEAAPGEFQLEGIRILDPVKDQIVAAAAQQLREDTHVRGKNAYREVGEEAPRFTLYNQLGEVVPFDRFRGQRVVLNFIFTRCPVATMCPASTAKMGMLQRLARERGIRDFQLLSITLDPAYDTPPVLKAYAEGRGIDSSNFNFLTGPEPAIRSLLAQFGVIAEPSDNIWKHTLATLLIDRDGKIVHRADGSAWEAEDFLKRL
ncbi:MAG: SCO family protein [Verrucomicrobia bacterium]|nr:SCO family protein [Verrucomicrobiota bacterium]